MKALTLKQPWAHHVARGDKRIENRTWEPPESLYAEQFAIHAGKSWDRNCQHPGPDKTSVCVEFGAIIAVVRIVCLVSSKEQAEKVRPGQGRWFVGPIGWVLEDVRPIVPLPCLGRQRLWNLSAKQRALVVERLAGTV